MSVTDTIKNAVGLGSDGDADAKSNTATKTATKTAARSAADTETSTRNTRAAATATDPKARAADKKPNAPIASGTPRAGAAAERDKTRIDPLVGTEYANNARTGTIDVTLRIQGETEAVQKALEKLLEKVEGMDGALVQTAEMRHGPASNIQVEALVSTTRRSEMEAEAKSAEENGRKVRKQEQKEQEERREAALAGS